MTNAKHWWSRVPIGVRKPIVLVVGSIFVLAAAATGWLPGPGGIPLFLVGVAILATEFVWAEKFRDAILEIIKRFAHWYKANKVLGTIVVVAAIAASATIAYLSYQEFQQD